MNDYLHKDWQTILANHQLDNFDAIWQLKADWFEPPNIDRGGWSGVVNVDLNADKEKIGVFIKRQENHSTKTLRHPIRGIPTLQREFVNILSFQNQGLPTTEPLFFAKRIHNDKLQAILITKALTDYIPLSSERFLPSGDLIQNAVHKRTLLIAVADTLRALHHHHFKHNCCYPKHILVKPAGASWDIRIIDLEKLKRVFMRRHARFRDLYTLQKYANNWSTKDKMMLFKAYMQEKKLSAKSKALAKSIEKRTRRKHK